jgi:cell division protein FtsZ
MDTICTQTGDDAIIKFGAVFDETLGDAMRVTVVATGLNRPSDFAIAKRSSLSRSVAQPQSILRQAAVRPGLVQHETRTGSTSR